MNKNLLLLATALLTGCVTLTADPETNRPKLSMKLGAMACAFKVKPDGAQVRCTKPFGAVDRPRNLLNNDLQTEAGGAQ